ncbi:lipoate--protein ligase family protein [Thermococcus argininiproducens]|uniref:Lipoate--protein ligase family protein n=1 Tax=Thermococcus argininiproducens TaxID=2866384 RepID=A0A9E7MB95_9EURY|nr:biotin/lipoate A/B protein ligase family protein [Thermococcus argininiproducens]USH00067.1 lipoate--protein ligase family protein [Thermococcus argininiproducens]
MPLRILITEFSDPYLNLAFEETLARVRAKDLIGDTLRIWRNEESVILGRFRKVEEDVNLKNLKRFKVPLIRRFTGGGTVYHDKGCLNYSLVIKRDVNYPLEYLYGVLLRGTLLALKKLGLRGYLKNTNDVVVNERKVSGTAASIRWGVLFLHGSLLINSDLLRLYSFLKIPKWHNFDPVKYRVANLSTFVKGIKMEDVVNALIWGYSRVLLEDLTFDDPLKEELKIAKILYEERYSKKEWNLNYPPRVNEREINEKIEKV